MGGSGLRSGTVLTHKVDIFGGLIIWMIRIVATLWNNTKKKEQMNIY